MERKGRKRGGEGKEWEGTVDGPLMQIPGSAHILFDT